MHPASPLGLSGGGAALPPLPTNSGAPVPTPPLPADLIPSTCHPPQASVCLPTLGSVLRLQLHFNPMSVATPAHWAMSQGTLLQQCLLLPVLPLSWLLL